MMNDGSSNHRNCDCVNGVPGSAGMAVQPEESDVVTVAFQSRRHAFHVPATLDETRCGLMILRPVRIEMRSRSARRLCRNCMKS